MGPSHCKSVGARIRNRWGVFCTRSLAALALAALASAPNTARADEGGVSFWVPGFFGSLAATPQTPGFSFAVIGYHTSVKAVKLCAPGPSSRNARVRLFRKDRTRAHQVRRPLRRCT